MVPVLRIDPLGLYSLDPSCTPCNADWNDDMERAIDYACAKAASQIRDPRLRECVINRCAQADFVVKCNANCPAATGGWHQPSHLFPGGPLGPLKVPDNQITICPRNLYSPKEAGTVFIHEVAHSCTASGWDHGFGMGVPDPNCTAGGPFCTDPWLNDFYPPKDF